MLLKSVGMARYIDRHMENVSVPDNIIARIQRAPDKIRECVLIASELLAAIRDAGYHGVHIATIGWEDKLPNIIGE